ncbi:MAG: glucosamine-6-phosphate deaminase [Pricia sp.]|nr:glucosamine-6-phosphate deaminase [Pricia sp.]
MKKSFTIDKLEVAIYEDSESVGEAAADYVQKKLRDAIAKKGTANLILATGASQFSFLEALKKREVEWQKITVFHLDEYKGISDSHPASFRKYLKDRILDAVAPKKIYFLNGDAENLEEEMDRYSKALNEHEIDVACIGIGENGHIAFNDPPVADFHDPKMVKLVELDDACRNQQLGEGWFPTFEDVPEEALTLTIPAIMRCKSISCVVPDERKAEAVNNTLLNTIDTACPATILRTHPETKLFLDTRSASKIEF